MGGSKGILKTAEQGVRDTFRSWRNDPLEGIANIATNYLTLGLVGYDADKGFKEGITIHSLDESVGAMSGRNAAREKGYEVERQIQETTAANARAREADLLARYRSDVQASRGAASARSNSVSRDTGVARANAAMMTNQKLGSEEGREYLGV